MSTVVFDTHAFVKRLTEVGITQEQAEVLADFNTTMIEEKLATKRDLQELVLATKRDLQELALATKRDLKELELRLTLRLGSMMVAAVGVVAVLTRVL